MTTAAAQGTLSGTGVHVPDTAQANRLHNKGTVGTPRTGNTLDLSLVEAAWCLAEGRLTIAQGGKALDVADLLAHAAKSGGRAEVDFLAYCDLRERGLVVRHAGTAGHFDVWPRGTSGGTPAFRVRACSDRDPIQPGELVQGAPTGLALAVVDDDGGVTYYNLALDEPRGEVPDAAVPPAKGRLLADRVLVADQAAAKAYGAQFIGNRRPGATFLSLLEAEALRQRGLLTLDGKLPKATGANHDMLSAVLPVYLDLRSRGVVAKSGFRFGTHLRGYRSNPDDDHAEWLVHCAGTSPLALSDLSRGVRLAHGVKKKFLVAVPTSGGIRYVHTAWFRP